MAKGSNYLPTSLARILIYGPPKSKKTWWALNAAQHGYNVIVLDCDDGAHIIAQQPKEILDKIDILNIQDNFDKATAAIFLARLVAGKPFYYNEATKLTALTAIPGATQYRIDPSKLTNSDVLVIDSWTAFSVSVAQKAAKERGIDLIELARDDQRDLFGYSNQFMNVALARLHALPCHVIVIGHQMQYDKYAKDGKTILSSRTQPISSTGPHGAKIAKDFSDILLTEFAGKDVRFNTEASAGKDCGSRHIPPGLYPWKDLQFIDMANKVGYAKPDPDAKCEGFVELTAEEAAEVVSSGGKSLLAKTGTATAENPPGNVAIKPDSAAKPAAVFNFGKKSS